MEDRQFACQEHSRAQDRMKRIEDDIRNFSKRVDEEMRTLNNAHKDLRNQFHLLQLSQIEDRGVIRNFDTKLENLNNKLVEVKEWTEKLNETISCLSDRVNQKLLVPDSFSQFISGIGMRIILFGVMSGVISGLMYFGVRVLVR